MNINPKQAAALVTMLIGNGIILYYMTVVFRNHKLKIVEGAMVMGVEMLVLLLLSFVLISGNRTKQVGQGVLIGTGITLLTGFTICSFV